MRTALEINVKLSILSEAHLTPPSPLLTWDFDSSDQVLLSNSSLSLVRLGVDFVLPLSQEEQQEQEEEDQEEPLTKIYPKGEC